MADFSAFENRTMKVTYDGETRRRNLAISPCASAAEAFLAIEAAVAALFEISPVAMVGYRITYPDEDGDLCTLTQHTVSDFAHLVPAGLIRLTLTKTSASGDEGSAEVNASSSPMEVDAAATDASPSGGTNGPPAPGADDALRTKLQGLSQKIPPAMRPFVLTMVQGMDPAALHNLLGFALAQIEQGSQGAEKNHESQEALNVLSTLRNMDPGALHALAVEVLRSGMDTDGDTGAEGSTSFRPQSSNPLEAMLGAFLGGKGCGKGQCTPGAASPNPFELLGPLLAGKGLGKGAGTADAPMPNPFGMEGFLKGMGKGAGYPQGAANDGQPTNPMQALLGSLLASKGSGKGFGPVHTSDVPSTTASDATADAASSNNGDATRAAFEESVNDLLNMGLVTDRQTARELLTQHGDISSVVALLADSEP